MTNKALLTILICLSVSSILLCQDLKTCTLSTSEQQKGIFKKFQYNSKEDYHVVDLVLNLNHSFFYEIKSFGYNAYSEGEWKESNDFITLKSSFQSDNLPVKIIYSPDPSGSKKIDIVQNSKNAQIHDALVYINQDSINCFPDLGCSERTKDLNIDSVKVAIGEIGSPWIKLSNNNTNHFLIVIETDLDLTHYLVLNEKKYRLFKSYLKQIN